MQERRTMTTTERLARFETAQEVLRFLMAVRSNLIYNEGKKTHPDATKIEQWEAERDELDDLEDALRFDDPAEIERIIATYGPQSRQLFRSRAN